MELVCRSLPQALSHLGFVALCAVQNSAFSLYRTQVYPDSVTIVLPCYNCVPFIEETVQRYSTFFLIFLLLIFPSILTSLAALS